MLIYRVEHRESGYGPYMHRYYGAKFLKNEAVTLDNLMLECFFKTNHPEPKRLDGKEFIESSCYRYAFGDPMELIYWFDIGWAVRKLDELGFIVRIYNIKDSEVVALHKQVAYVSDGVKMVEEHTLMQFWEDVLENA